MSIITLTTDFGDSDHYVACMKGVILQRAPRAEIVDVTHHVQRHDAVHAAFILRQVFEYFPGSTIHVAVIDPGVGTTRRIIAVQYDGGTVLAPDNGLVSLIHRDYRMIDLRAVENERLFRSEISNTFHGRDIFAPVAAHLAQGAALESVGPQIYNLQILNLPRPALLSNRAGIEGQVLYIDRFGNLISNISADDLESSGLAFRHINVHVGPLQVGPLRRAYGDVQPGEIVALVGSTGMLEVAINRGSAAEQLRAGPGTVVMVRT